MERYERAAIGLKDQQKVRQAHDFMDDGPAYDWYCATVPDVERLPNWANFKASFLKMFVSTNHIMDRKRELYGSGQRKDESPSQYALRIRRVWTIAAPTMREEELVTLIRSGIYDHRDGDVLIGVERIDNAIEILVQREAHRGYRAINANKNKDLSRAGTASDSGNRRTQDSTSRSNGNDRRFDNNTRRSNTMRSEPKQVHHPLPERLVGVLMWSQHRLQ